MDQYIGRLLDDRYEILEILGTGGMAVVYKARCHRLNRLVAIKILKDEFARDEEFRRRFHAEGEAVAMLSHPNIVQVYDVSSSDNANFIVMELIDGISLKQYMEKKGVLNWKETLHFAMQIAKGLEHAHSRGIVHRDIKPHNVMVLKNGSVKVMDFGIARVMNKSNTLTKEALGSVHYISPEQAKGGFTDNRSDLYSLSVVMYEMMTGRPPYDGESAVAVAIQHINGGAMMPSKLNPNIPGGLEQIIMKGMALEIQDRYPSATEMLQDMEEFRKNPAIQFNYRSIIDDATRAITGIPNIARTTAEKVVQAKTGVKPQSRVTSDSARMRSVTPAASVTKGTSGRVGTSTGTMTRAEAARRARLRQQMEEKQREEERRARVTTTAIVVCSAVAIIAIIAFLVALFNGALLNQENDYVEVPNLVGQMYGDDLMQQYDDFVILLQPQEYSDEHAKGVILRQEPAAYNKVKKNSDLRITVSLGAEPEVKMMDDYVGYAQEGVKAALEGQGFKPIFREEASDLYKAGEIIRTEPVAGTELEEGQTIKIWVSTGPDVVLQKMPDVLGMEQSVAESLLNQLGFEKIRTRPVESDKPKGVVVYQSETHNVEIDVTTEILLEISEGPEETEPTTEPTQPPTDPPATNPPTEPPTDPPMVTANATFQIPVKDVMYVLSIYHGGVEVVGPVQIQPGTASYTVALSGIGSQNYDVYVDGFPYNTQTVEFSNG